MKILYLSTSYIPSRRASSMQVMKMCQALTQQGHQVTLVTKACPPRQEAGVEDDYGFHAVEPIFSIKKLPRPVWRGGGLVYIWYIWWTLRAQQDKFDLVYSRDLAGAQLATCFNYPVLYEVHGVPQGRLSRYLLQILVNTPTFRRLVVISKGLKQDLSNLDLLPTRDKIIIAHDGSELFDVNDSDPMDRSVFDSNRCLNLGYVGHLYPGKGMDVIVELAKRFQEHTFHIIGGREKDLSVWKRKTLSNNLSFHGFVNPSKISSYYRRLDLLLLPPQRHVYGASGRDDISRWMSPMKMFEYMATGKPIVSSDLPVLREVLEHERNALLVPPDDVDAWEAAIKRLAADKHLGHQLGQTAQQDLLDHYTWKARAKKVLDGL